MNSRLKFLGLLFLTFFALMLSSCATTSSNYADNNVPYREPLPANADDRMPQQIASTGKKTIVVDPSVHAWGAYDTNGQLVRSGIATSGGSWCPDIGRSCRTKVGTFHIQSLGSESCKSHIYPLPHGGARMPYCMFFNGGQGLHGSYDVVDANVSHGCVRVQPDEAEWIRYNFASIGTRLVVRPY